jgi:hypothetical protein
LYDFTKTQLIPPDQAYCIAGKVNSTDKLYLVIESVRPDTKHARCSKLLPMLTAREGRLSSSTTLFAEPATLPRCAPNRRAGAQSCASASMLALATASKPAKVLLF